MRNQTENSCSWNNRASYWNGKLKLLFRKGKKGESLFCINRDSFHFSNVFAFSCRQGKLHLWVHCSSPRNKKEFKIAFPTTKVTENWQGEKTYNLVKLEYFFFFFCFNYCLCLFLAIEELWGYWSTPCNIEYQKYWNIPLNLINDMRTLPLIWFE